MSIHSSTFPKLWKMGKITSLFKKGSTQDPGNYRPISILPVLSKLLEKHVAIHLLEFLNSHDLLHSQQSGFRAKHSCKTALHYNNYVKWLAVISPRKRTCRCHVHRLLQSLEPRWPQATSREIKTTNSFSQHFIGSHATWLRGNNV